MPRGNYTIQRSCEEYGKIFTPPTLVSKYVTLLVPREHTKKDISQKRKKRCAKH